MKKLLVAFLFAMMAIVSQASYLYWQVSVSDDVFTAYKADTALVYATDGNTTTDIAGASFNQTNGGMQTVATAIDSQYLAEGWSYYVELVSYDNSGNMIVHATSSEVTAYAQLQNCVYSNNNLAHIPAVWTGGAVAVPEPTSAMMILLGLAGLALKRKQI